MKILPAIDILDGKAVRLYKGDYESKTVYGDPIEEALKLKKLGAEYLHIVDLNGAKSGLTENFDIISRIVREVGIFCEVGGGIRSLETAEKYLSSGVGRVIFGTAAVANRNLICKSISTYKSKIAVGADILGRSVRTSGWLSDSKMPIGIFISEMEQLGVKTVICTDISRDGALSGLSVELYEKLCRDYPDIDIIASGGVTTLDEIIRLKKVGVGGAIIGKAYYTGLIDINKAIETAK